MSASNGTDARLGWVASNGRGTIDIIWGCVLTIFLCVWTVLTLNVPAPDTLPPASIRAKMKWAILGPNPAFTRTKLKWAILALFGPEFLSGFAGAQWSIARRSKRLFQDCGINWTMRQSFLADMGGVRVKLEDDEFPVTSKQIFVLVKLGLVKIDTMSTAAIDDRSKADSVTKLITVVQTVWFILQCLARLKQQIGITTLELSTMAFVVCTIGTNIMWWSKPKDVFVPVILTIDCTLEALLAMVGPAILDAKTEAKNWKWSPLETFDDLRPNLLIDVGQYLPRTNSFDLSQEAQKIRLRNDRLPPLERDWPLNCFLFLLSLSFTAVYVAGWNISLPTHTERIIWRICTVMLFFFVFAFWAIDAGVELYQRKNKVSGDEKVAVTPVKMALYSVIVISYVIIRFYILVEPFVCLRSLRANSFRTIQWSSFIPHI